MEDCDKTNSKSKDEERSSSFLQRFFANVSHVFLTFWLRCIVQINYGHNRILLGSRYHILLYIRMFLVILYFLVEIYKVTR